MKWSIGGTMVCGLGSEYDFPLTSAQRRHQGQPTSWLPPAFIARIQNGEIILEEADSTSQGGAPRDATSAVYRLQVGSFTSLFICTVLILRPDGHSLR